MKCYGCGKEEKKISFLTTPMGETHPFCEKCKTNIKSQYPKQYGFLNQKTGFDELGKFMKGFKK